MLSVELISCCSCDVFRQYWNNSETSKMFRRQFRHFVVTTKTTKPRPQVFSVNGSITCNRMHFWRHFDVVGSISQFGQQQLVMVSYTCGFDQSETGKCFEWIIMNNFIVSFIFWRCSSSQHHPPSMPLIHSIPFPCFSRDHLRSTIVVIYGRGSFAVYFGDHLRSGIIWEHREVVPTVIIFDPFEARPHSSSVCTNGVCLRENQTNECLKPAFF